MTLNTVIQLISFAGTILAIGIAWGRISTQVAEIKDSLTNEVRPDLKDVRERLAAVEMFLGHLRMSVDK